MTVNPNTTTCPACHSDWRGPLIPPEQRHLYEGTQPHFSRLIGVELPYDHPEHYDGVSRWCCPDCGQQWNRWTGEKVP